MESIIIISCGRDKKEGSFPARELYEGQYFQRNLAAAIAEVGEERVFILSAKHGIIACDEVIESYDVRMGDEGSITPEMVRDQVEKLGLVGWGLTSYVLASKLYFDFLSALGKDIGWYPMNVFEADPGIGFQASTARIIKEMKNVEA